MGLDYKLSKSNVYKFFPQPIFSYEIDDYKKINNELSEFIYSEYNKDNEGVKRSNINGWHSKSFKFEKNNAAYKFAIHIEKYIFDVFKQYGWPFKADKVKINEMWSIINKKNSYNESHIHPNNLLSSVYYVRAPKDCGKIIFNNPNQVSLNRFPKDLKKPEFSANIQKIEPKEGNLLLFPSYLWHSVETNNSDEDRVIVSFNVSLSD